jgi:hypothetical protein
MQAKPGLRPRLAFISSTYYLIMAAFGLTLIVLNLASAIIGA